MGQLDRVVRSLISINIVVFYIKGVITGLTGGILLLFAGIFLVTAVVAYCPVYSIFHFRSRKN
jgi:hypothetical protein